VIVSTQSEPPCQFQVVTAIGHNEEIASAFQG
jgi:hypothetical protein